IASEDLRLGEFLHRNGIVAGDGPGTRFGGGGEGVARDRCLYRIERFALAEIGGGGGDSLEPGFQGSIGREPLLLFGSAALQGSEGGVFCRTELLQQRIERQP